MKFHLRDILWLLLIVAVALGWWRDRVARQIQMATLANEVKYLQSAAPLCEFVDEDYDKFVAFMATQHQMRIDVDWDSLEKLGYTPKKKATYSLQDGSLPWRIEVLFQRQAKVVSTPLGILITAKDVKNSEQAP